MRCTGCTSPTSQIRCSGCHDAVYCDAQCRRRDWIRHRIECWPLGGARIVAYDWDDTLSVGVAQAERHQPGSEQSAHIGDRTHQLVASVAARGVRQIVVSYALREVIVRSLEAAGITEISEVYTPEMFGIPHGSHPHLRKTTMLDIACAREPCARELCVLVDDSKENTEEAATAGFRAVQLPAQGGVEQALCDGDGPAAWAGFERHGLLWVPRD